MNLYDNFFICGNFWAFLGPKILSNNFDIYIQKLDTLIKMLIPSFLDWTETQPRKWNPLVNKYACCKFSYRSFYLSLPICIKDGDAATVASQ